MKANGKTAAAGKFNVMPGDTVSRLSSCPVPTVRKNCTIVQCTCTCTMYMYMYNVHGLACYINCDYFVFCFIA